MATTWRTIEHLIREAYVPFANIERALPWPGTNEGITDATAPRFENDAEHSFALSFVGAAMAEELGLDPGKIALYATYHDFVERYAGDTSAWDDAGLKTKQAREEQALQQIKTEFKNTPKIAQVIEAYEAQADEEARFVYSLDKFVSLILIYVSGGLFWQHEGITFEQHLAKVDEIRPKIAKHPVVLQWYDDALAALAARKGEFFAG